MSLNCVEPAIRNAAFDAGSKKRAAPEGAARRNSQQRDR
jgi:hypothetical protein